MNWTGPIVDGLNQGLSFGKAHGIWIGILVGVLVVIMKVVRQAQQESEQRKIAQLPPEEQHQIQMRKENQEEWGCIIGFLLAAGISVWIAYVIFWG